MSKDFKFAKRTHLSMHDVVTTIKEIKTKNKGQKFLTSFREYLGRMADSQLSKFLQKHYTEDSAKLHDFLELPLWEEPKQELKCKRASKQSKNK